MFTIKKGIILQMTLYSYLKKIFIFSASSLFFIVNVFIVHILLGDLGSLPNSSTWFYLSWIRLRHLMVLTSFQSKMCQAAIGHMYYYLWKIVVLTFIVVFNSFFSSFSLLDLQCLKYFSMLHNFVSAKKEEIDSCF